MRNRCHVLTAIQQLYGCLCLCVRAGNWNNSDARQHAVRRRCAGERWRKQRNTNTLYDASNGNKTVFAWRAWSSKYEAKRATARTANSTQWPKMMGKRRQSQMNELTHQLRALRAKLSSNRASIERVWRNLQNFICSLISLGSALPCCRPNIIIRAVWLSIIFTRICPLFPSPIGRPLCAAFVGQDSRLTAIEHADIIEKTQNYWSEGLNCSIECRPLYFVVWQIRKQRRAKNHELQCKLYIQQSLIHNRPSTLTCAAMKIHRVPAYIAINSSYALCYDTLRLHVYVHVHGYPLASRHRHDPNSFGHLFSMAHPVVNVCSAESVSRVLSVCLCYVLCSLMKMWSWMRLCVTHFSGRALCMCLSMCVCESARA